MTAEAGECNGRIEGSKREFEAKGGGDLKDDGVACRDAEEIGGSFVIVNGDSDDQSDRDLDLKGTLDPKVGLGNGGSKWDDEEIGGKEESLGGGGVANGDENHSLDNGGDVAEKPENVKLVEERSNGDEVKKEEGDLVMQEEENVIGSSSDVNEEEEEETENVVKLDSDARVVGEEVEADVDGIEVQESEKVDDLDSDARIEHEEDAVNAAEEKHDTEVLAVAEERESEVVIDEGEPTQDLGSEVEREDMKKLETAALEKSELDHRAGEEQEAVSAVAEAVEEGDVESINVVENQKPVDGVGESEKVAELEPAIEAERGQEAYNVVAELYFPTRI